MAKSMARRISKQVVVYATMLLVLAFLHVCLVPYLNPMHFWWVGFAGLAAPYLMVLLLFAVFFLLIVKPQLAIIPVIVLCIGYKQLAVLFGTKMRESFSVQKSKNALRIVDWNIQSFNGLTSNKNSKKLIRTDLAESVIKLSPDVICLQEFNHAYNQGEEADNIGLFSGEYAYHFFSKDYTRNKGNYVSGCIIFSKYPIIRAKKIQYPRAESLIYADIVKGTDTIRIFTTHLQSFKFKKDDYNDIEKIKEQEETLNASKSIVNKMKPAFQRRGIQADMVKEALDESPYPSIISGDFNDVPNSYTYFQIKGNRKDAFLEKGFGIGRSFISIAPTLRIDYILPSNQFDVQQFDMVDEGLSDHIMLVADCVLQHPTGQP